MQKASCQLYFGVHCPPFQPLPLHFSTIPPAFQSLLIFVLGPSHWDQGIKLHILDVHVVLLNGLLVSFILMFGRNEILLSLVCSWISITCFDSSVFETLINPIFFNRTLTKSLPQVQTGPNTWTVLRAFLVVFSYNDRNPIKNFQEFSVKSWTKST